MVMEGEKLWAPRKEFADASNIARYQRWLKAERGIDTADYHALWQWSVKDTAGFWASIWDYFEVQSDQPYRSVLERPADGHAVVPRLARELCRASAAP
jgi:acetoacetyl-CoA synthetase